MDVGAQSSEIKTLQRRLDLLSRKEARLQVSQILTFDWLMNVPPPTRIRVVGPCQFL